MVSSLSQKQLCADDEISYLRAALSGERKKNKRLSEKVKQLAITQHKLYASKARLDSQMHTYRKLYELGKSFNKALDLSAALKLATEFILYELGFERCLVLLFNSARNVYEVKAFDGYYDPAEMASLQSLNLLPSDPVVQRLSQDQDYEICLQGCDDALLCEWRSRLGMDEYIMFALRQETEEPLGLLIVGNTADRSSCHTPVTQEAEGFLRLANTASQIATALISVGFYWALQEERSHLEKSVQLRTQDLELVAGIAHEINNPVSLINGNLYHAQGHIQDLLKLIATYQTHYPNPHEAVQAMLYEIDPDFLSEDLPTLMDSMQKGATQIEKIALSLHTKVKLPSQQKPTTPVF